jgi:hypothetical protein
MSRAANPIEANLIRSLANLVNAIDYCEGNRGRFSCGDAHDCRCPKARSPNGKNWKGQWRCECGAEELEREMEIARKLLKRLTSLHLPARSQR